MDESKHPDIVSSAMLIQGIFTMLPFSAAALNTSLVSAYAPFGQQPIQGRLYGPGCWDRAVTAARASVLQQRAADALESKPGPGDKLCSHAAWFPQNSKQQMLRTCPALANFEGQPPYIGKRSRRPNTVFTREVSSCISPRSKSTDSISADSLSRACQTAKKTVRRADSV